MAIERERRSFGALAIAVGGTTRVVERYLARRNAYGMAECRMRTGLRAALRQTCVTARGAGFTRRSLLDLHARGILMQMRTTLNLDDELLQRALRLSGLKEKTAVLHAGLEALIQRESARRLAALGGTERKLKSVPRRRAKRG